MAFAATSTGFQPFNRYEFLLFSLAAFVGKAALLIRLPYREIENNALYTGLLLAFFYLYLRFRQHMAPPLLIVFLLAAAVAVDVLGNFFQLYGRLKFGPVEFDDISHMLGSGFALPPAMWLLRTTTMRMGIKLPLDLLAFLAVTITFSFTAFYEILELWDELFWGDFTRLWTPRDSPIDLQYNLAGIIIAAFISMLAYKIMDGRAETRELPA